MNKNENKGVESPLSKTEKRVLTTIKYICVIAATIVCYVGVTTPQYNKTIQITENKLQSGNETILHFTKEQEIDAMVNPEIVNIQVPLVRKCIKKIGIVRDEDGKLTCYAITLHEAMEIYYTKQDLKSPKGAQSSAPLEDITPIPNTPK